MTLRLRAAAVAALSLALAAAPRVADGAAPEPSPHVAVVATADAEITARLVAELEFLGFSADVVDMGAQIDLEGLRALARERSAAAAIAIDGGDGRVEVWIVDRMTGKLVARELELSQGDDPPREIAVRAVELLRASLAEVEARPAPPEAEVAVGPAARRTLADPIRRRIVLGLAPAVGGAPGGLGVMAHARAQLRWAPHPIVGVVLGGAAPLHRAKLRAPEGSAGILTGWIDVGPWFALRRADAKVIPDLSPRIGVAIVGMQGRAAQGLSARRARLVDAIVEAVAGLEVVVSTRVRLRFEASAATCARTIRVRFVARDVASWCRPHVLGAAGIGVGLW